MVRSALLFFACCLILQSFPQAQSLSAIRRSFHQAVLDPDNTEAFHSFVDEIKSTNATIKAYQAVSEAMMARVIWNPLSKLSQVRKYNRMMNIAVAEDIENVEIRFLRLAIEYNLPKFLGYSVHLVEDKDLIVSNLSRIDRLKIDSSFGRYILHFLNETGLCDESQIEQMKETLKRNVVQTN